MCEYITKIFLDYPISIISLIWKIMTAVGLPSRMTSLCINPQTFQVHPLLFSWFSGSTAPCPLLPVLTASGSAAAGASVMAVHRGPSTNWLFTREQLENTPSRRCGIEADRELSYRQQAANLIQDMGQKLNVYPLWGKASFGWQCQGACDSFCVLWC